MSKKHNFSAGPSILPQEVFHAASEAVLNLDGTGLSLIEISHRSKEFVAIMENARNLVRELLEVPDNYSVLFLQGGASLGFYMAAMNFMRENGHAAYIDTGAWSSKAIKEANIAGTADVVASSKDRNYCYIPKDFGIPEGADYLHITTNNTIFGTQFASMPEVDIPIIADMSSDIFSRRIDVSKFAMIYAGAQKNMGPAGTTLFIVNNDLLGKTGRTIPSMLNLATHIDKDSMFNTPPVFAVYTAMKTLEWLKSNGGLNWIENKNREKAELLYNEIDSNPIFNGTADHEDRSRMNVTFIMEDESRKEEFDQLWPEANISGIKGHRSVGGYRASIYNAMPIESVQVLVDTMRKLNN